MPKYLNLCPHDPRETNGAVGMYHCPVCRQMVLAGVKHIDWDTPDDSPVGDPEQNEKKAKMNVFKKEEPNLN